MSAASPSAAATRISVVIPTYNAERFLEEAIASVRAQTRPADEIVVVDDASADGSAALAERLGARVIRQPRNAGAAAARNLGARVATGDVMAWLDADDLWEPEHLETVVGLLERFPEAVLAFAGAGMIGDRSDDWPMLLPHEEPVSAFWASLRRCVLLPTTTAIRRQAFLDAGGFDERIRVYEDYDLWLRLARTRPFVCSHRITTRWRRHEAQTSRDIRVYWAGEYETRMRVLRDMERTESPELVERVRETIREVWQEHLSNAWHSRRPDHMAFHLRMLEFVPGAEPLAPAWRRRLRLMPLLPVWDAVAGPLRRRRRRARAARG